MISPGNEQNQDQAMEEALTFRPNYGEIIKRRLPLSLAVGLTLLLLTLGLAFGLPSVYKSRAVILIEAQEIPQDLVRSLVTSFADQRMQTIAQRVLTNANLGEIIQKYDLYADIRKREALETVLERMRGDISMLPISADVVDPKQGRAVQATIAFELAYESESPQMAQRVANEIASLFLNENLKQRTEASADTLGFLSSESEKLRDTVGELESKLAEFKKGNVERLPELTNLNLELMNRTEVQLNQLETQLQSLQQQRVYLESELAQQKPSTQMISETGERILGPADRLKVMESEFTPLAARYGANHPDVVSMRREIEALRAQVGGGNAGSELSLKLQQAQADYAQASKKYAPEHPDVKRLAREVESLRTQLAGMGNTAPMPAPAATPDNPAYIQLQARLSATESDIASVRSQQATLRAKLAELEDRITNSPEVERQYRMLMRDYEIAQAKYQEVLAKRQEAELASSLESKQRGERFTMIEPPVIPEEPASPNRLAIGLLGVLLSLACSVGGGALAENLDRRIYGRNGVTSVLGVPPLAVIPDMDTGAKGAWTGGLALKVGIAAAVLVVLGTVVIHLTMGPLDVFFFRVLRFVGF
jgi:succinoglycan biosynthesis transport protein ExoP